LQGHATLNSDRRAVSYKLRFMAFICEACSIGVNMNPKLGAQCEFRRDFRARNFERRSQRGAPPQSGLPGTNELDAIIVFATLAGPLNGRRWPGDTPAADNLTTAIARRRLLLFPTGKEAMTASSAGAIGILCQRELHLVSASVANSTLDCGTRAARGHSAWRCHDVWLTMFAGSASWR
jgi:hypothetical protein